MKPLAVEVEACLECERECVGLEMRGKGEGNTCCVDYIRLKDYILRIEEGPWVCETICRHGVWWMGGNIGYLVWHRCTMCGPRDTFHVEYLV